MRGSKRHRKAGLDLEGKRPYGQTKSPSRHMLQPVVGSVTESSKSRSGKKTKRNGKGDKFGKKKKTKKRGREKYKGYRQRGEGSVLQSQSLEDESDEGGGKHKN